MAIIIEMYPPVVLELQLEMEKHPLLTNQLNPNMSLEEKIGTIATYCGVVVDGSYSEKALEGLFELLLKRLKDKSCLLVTPSYLQ